MKQFEMDSSPGGGSLLKEGRAPSGPQSAFGGSGPARLRPGMRERRGPLAAKGVGSPYARTSRDSTPPGEGASGSEKGFPPSYVVVASVTVERRRGRRPGTATVSGFRRLERPPSNRGRASVSRKGDAGPLSSRVRRGVLPALAASSGLVIPSRGGAGGVVVLPPHT
jgi:hypothetical protein